MKRAVLAIALGVAAWSPASAQDAPSAANPPASGAQEAPSGLTPVYAPAPRSSSAPSGNVARPSASAQDDGAAREDASAQEGASARNGASAQHGGDAPSSPTPPPVSPSGSRATLVPEPASVEIGEPVEWMLDVVHPKKLRVGFPAKDAEDRRFAPLSERTVARAADPNDDALVHTIARWTTMALEPGDLAPPPLALELTGGAATETLVVNGLPVHVAGALAEGEDAPRPLLGLRELSPERAAQLEPARRAPLVLAGLGALLVAALGVFLVRRRAKPTLPSEPTPLARLDAIAAAFAADPESGRARVYELSRLLRGSVDGFLGVERSGRTDDDWARAVEADERVPAGVRSACGRLLASAERVKYAQETPTRFAVDEFLRDARAVLEALASAPRPAPDVAKESNAAAPVGPVRTGGAA